MGGPASACRGTSTRPLVLLLALLAGFVLVPTQSSEQQPRTLYVNSTDPTCQGQASCFATIQAARPGDAVRIQPGTDQEQVTIQEKNNSAGADEPDRIKIEADPGSPPGSVVLLSPVTQTTNGHSIRLQQSKFITIRGLTITGAGAHADRLGCVFRIVVSVPPYGGDASTRPGSSTSSQSSRRHRTSPLAPT